MADQKTVVSPKWTVQLRDWLNGLWLAIIGGVGGSLVSLVMDWMAAGTFHVDLERLQTIGVGAIGFGLLYVIKRFTDPAKVILINPDQQAVDTLNQGGSVVVSK